MKTKLEPNSELLDDLLFEASEATNQPPTPKGGIPKQWVPFWVRLPIKWLVLPFVLIDYFMQKIAKKITRGGV